MNDTLNTLLESLGLELQVQHVPTERKPKGEWSYIQWNVTLSRGKQSITTDYKMGLGYIDYSYNGKLPPFEKGQIESAVMEKGAYKGTYQDKRIHATAKKPTLSDVLYSLLADAKIGDTSFEDACWEYELNSDSIKDKAIWEACRDIHFKLQRMFSNNELDALNEAFQDY